MAAYDMLLDLIREYFIHLGYNNNYIFDFFSNSNFKSILSIRLANSNVMISNKTDKRSHQTHIAVTGEGIEFFYNYEDFLALDNTKIDRMQIEISDSNLKDLKHQEINLFNTFFLKFNEGIVTVGKRTQNQVQLSKKNRENSEFFNSLRLGLFENDLLIMLKYRNKECILAIGIPQTFYLDYIPNYVNQYEANTYLCLPKV